MPPPVLIPRTVQPRRPSLLDPRRRSLLRGNILVLGSLVAALFLSHFPQNHPSPLLLIPLLLATWGTVDTARCMQRRWNFYHAGVILCIYMDLMALGMVFFFLVYPYISSGIRD